MVSTVHNAVFGPFLGQRNFDDYLSVGAGGEGGWGWRGERGSDVWVFAGWPTAPLPPKSRNVTTRSR